MTSSPSSFDAFLKQFIQTLPPGLAEFKKDLGQVASAKLSPISLEMNRLMKDKKYLDSIISNGKDKAISVAQPVLSNIYEIIGFFR